MRTSTIAVGLLTAVLFAAGCGSGSDPGSGPEAQVDANGEVANGGLDAPNPGGDQPSADLPGLPIGGQVPDTALTADAPSGCGTVAWVGPGEQIPEGIEVVITGFDLPDQVRVEPAACGGAGPACIGGVSFRADQTSCTLGVTWNGEAPETLSVGAEGLALCDDQATCDQFEASLVPQAAVLSIEVTEPEDGESLVTPSMTETPSDGTE